MLTVILFVLAFPILSALMKNLIDVVLAVSVLTVIAVQQSKPEEPKKPTYSSVLDEMLAEIRTPNK